MTVEYKCIDVYKKPENPMEWLPCPRCGLRPLVWEFDNGRFTACGCGTDCYSHWSVRAESIMSVIKRSDNGKSAEVYDIDELKNNWNHWVRTGEILFTPGNGRWLAVQELANDGRWTQAAEELVSSCGLTEDECRELQEESGSFNDEMLDFINSVFGHEDMINNSITLENIGYHKIGSIFKYNIGSKEVELEVVESSDASCEGRVFNNSKNYYCKDTHCIDVDRKDDIDVIYKEVKRS